MTPQRFGKYELIQELGRGGMGIVWKAFQADLNRHVALKFLQATEDEDLRRFEREAQTAAGLTHPNIAQIHEVGVVDGKRFIAMQFVDGKTLGAGLAPKQIAETMRDAARAIEYAHTRGVIHRDLKPANIMRDDRGHVFVMDFGLARPVAADSSLTASGAIVGTPTYMSPEQAQGARDLDARTDVYSLGATLYDLLTGTRPFAGDTPMAVIMAVINTDPVPPRRINPRVHADLETICLKAMEKEPSKRYATAREFADELDRFLQGEPILAKPSTFFSLVAKRVRKHRAVSISVSAAVLIAVAAGGVFLGMALTKRASIARLMSEGDAAFARGDWGVAKEKYDGALALDPTLTTMAAECQVRLEAAMRAKEREDRRRAATAPFEAGRKAFDDATLLLYKRGARKPDRLQALEAAEARFTEALGIFDGYAEAYVYRARCRLDLTRMAGALADFEAAMKLDPDLGPAYFHRGLGGVAVMVDMSLHVRSGRGFNNDLVYIEIKRRALEDLRTAATKLREPDKEELALAWVDVIERRFEEALARLDTLVGRERGLEEAHYLRGVCLDEMERREDAILAYSKAVDLRANYVEAIRGRGAQRYELDRAAEAEADFAELVRWDEADAEATAQLGVVRIRIGKHEEGLALVERAKGLAPGNAHTLVLHARALIELGRHESALAELDAIVERAQDLDAVFTRGCLYFQQERWKDAERDFERVLRELPDDVEAVYHRGLCRYHLKRYEECVADMTAAAKRFGSDAEVLGTRGLALWELGRLDEARRDFDAAVAAAPEDAAARSNRMEFRFSQEQWKPMLDDAEALLKRKPDDGHALIRRGRARLELGELAAARTDIEAGVKAAPERPDAWRTRALLRERTGDWKGAIADYEKTVELAPDWVEPWAALGTHRLRVGRWDAAVQALDEALARNPKHAGALANRGFAYFYLERWKDAVADLERAVELEPSLEAQVGEKLKAAREKASNPK